MHTHTYTHIHTYIHIYISEKLLERSQDMDEKVRLEAVKTICEIASENLTCVSNKVCYHVLII